MLAFEIFCLYVAINCLITAFTVYIIKKNPEADHKLLTHIEDTIKDLGESRTAFLAVMAIVCGLGMLPITILSLIKGGK